MRLWSGSFMVLLRLKFPLHLRALRTQDDISFASPLHSVHMKNKIRAVTWSFIQSIYQRRFYIFTLFHPSPTHSYIIHIRFCVTSHIYFTALLLFFALLFCFLHFLCFLIHHYISLHFLALHWDSISYTFSRQTKQKKLNFICTWWLMVVWAVRLHSSLSLPDRSLSPILRMQHIYS